MFVAEEGNERVSVFRPDGQFVRAITNPPQGSKPRYLPMGLACHDGLLYVPNCRRAGLVSVFRTDGQFVRQFGHEGPGKLKFPTGVTVHRDQVLVCSNHCVTVFGLDGSFVRQIGSERSGSGDHQFCAPSDLACFDSAVFVADWGNQRVHVIARDSL